MPSQIWEPLHQARTDQWMVSTSQNAQPQKQMLITFPLCKVCVSLLFPNLLSYIQRLVEVRVGRHSEILLLSLWRDSCLFFKSSKVFMFKKNSFLRSGTGGNFQQMNLGGYKHLDHSILYFKESLLKYAEQKLSRSCHPFAQQHQVTEPLLSICPMQTPHWQALG